ncbi:MAG: type II CAAX endopeptidase family protein [Candidatus Acidiferrales bacterium]
MPWDFILILAVLAILVPWRGGVRIRQLLSRPTISTEERLALYASTIGFQWLAAGIVFWRCAAHRYSGAQLGLALEKPAATVTIGLAIAALLISNQIFSIRRLATFPPKKQGLMVRIARQLMPHAHEETLVFVALVATVAICEEFLYRGFVQAVFEDAAQGRVVVGILVSAVFFAVAHVYQGRRGLIVTFFIGLLFSLTRSWTGSILPSVIAHFATDLSAGLASRRWLSRATPTGGTEEPAAEAVQRE